MQTLLVVIIVIIATTTESISFFRHNIGILHCKCSMLLIVK